MITKTQQHLNELFNVDPAPVQSLVKVEQEVEEEQYPVATQDANMDSYEDEQFKNHIETDSAVARQNLRDLLSSGEVLLDLAIRSAQDTENAKNIESAARVLGQLADINMKLLDVTSKKQEVFNKTRKNNAFNKFNQLGFEGDAVPIVNQVTNNTMFVGTAADLAKMLKQVKEEQEIVVNENSITN